MSADASRKPITISDVAPELRADIQKFPSLPMTNGFSRWVVRALVTLTTLRRKQYDGVRVEKRQTRGGNDVYVYTPTSKPNGGALLWIHGGGLVIGHPLQSEEFCADTARGLGIVVISVRYRLAPENPFPAALDDCHAAWAWIQESAAQLAIDPARVAIGGQSAGGGLTAGLVQRIHDAGGVQPAAQWLFCPMLDDRTAARRELDVVSHLIWNNRLNRMGWGSYLGAEPGADRVPAYAVPARREDLRGLPPAWVGVGDIDLFFDEDKTYAERLKAAGVDCAIDVVADAPHAFETIAGSTSLARAFIARAWMWLGSKLSG